MNSTENSHLKTFLSTGVLSPYLSSEPSLWLAARVIASLAPSQIPQAEDEFKLFGEMINLIAMQPGNRQFQIAYALAVWPHAAFLTCEECYTQASVFPDEMSIDGYQFVPFKSFNDVICGRLPSDFFKHMVNDHLVALSITAPAIQTPVAHMMMCFLPNLARPLDPFNWFMRGLLRDTKTSEAEKIDNAMRNLVSIANASYRPYS